MKKPFISLIMLALIGVIFINIALSWDDKTTHKYLAQYAAKNSVLSKNKGDYLKNFGFVDALDTSIKWSEEKSITKWLQEGAEYEDKPTLRSFNHFHNPLKEWNQAGLDENIVIPLKGKSSLLWSQDGSYQQSSVGEDWSWQKARDYYYRALTSMTDSERQENFAKMFRGLGHQIHLIQDKTVPDHVRNDAHPEDSIFGKNRFNGSQYFETWAKNNQAIVNAHASRAGQFIPNVSLTVSYENLVPISQFYDTNQYVIENPSQFFTNNKATSLAIGLSEYTNSNFFSGDTIFAAERYSPDHRHYFPYPQKSSTDLEEYLLQVKPLVTQIAEDGIKDSGIYIKKIRDGEVIDNFVRASRWTGKLYKMFGEGTLFYRSFYRDEKCHEDYASKLIPRAVGYSAGLLNYFFRGDIDMVPDNSGSGYVIENKTDEDMDGTFELWYDDAYDKRKIAWDSKLSIGRKSKSSGITFTPPDSMKEDGKYMLVFRGELGKEKDAVIGKEVELGRYYIFLVNMKDKDFAAFRYSVKNGRYEFVSADPEQIENKSTLSGSTIPTIQSHPNKNEHVVSLPPYRPSPPYEESICLKYPTLSRYGVGEVTIYYEPDKVWTISGSRTLYRPDNFTENAPYVIGSTSLDGYPNVNVYPFLKDARLDAGGRHNFVMSRSNPKIMDAYAITVWHDKDDQKFILYKDKSDRYVLGNVIAQDEKNHVLEGDYYNYTETVNDTTHSMIAVISKDKVVYRKLNQEGFKARHSSSQNNEYITDITNNNFLLLGDEIIEEDTGNYTSYFSSDKYDVDYKRDTGIDHYVMAYDNLCEDKYFIMFYRKVGKDYNSEETFIWTDPSYNLYKSPHIDNNRAEITYKFVYNVNGLRQNITLAENSARKNYTMETGRIKCDEPGYITCSYYDISEEQEIAGQRIIGVSTQINSDNIVYTYVVEETDYSSSGSCYSLFIGCQPSPLRPLEWEFVKRVIGIINISNQNLPIGYRQEFEITETNATHIFGTLYQDEQGTVTYDYKDLAAIGVHRE